IGVAIGKVRWRQSSCVGRPSTISALGCYLIYTGHAYKLSKQVPRLRTGQGFLSRRRSKIFICKIWYLISRTVSEDDAHRGSIDDRAFRAFAVKPRAFSAPLCGVGA